MRKMFDNICIGYENTVLEGLDSNSLVRCQMRDILSN